jgi:CDP-glucose 4,6-dehydratase
MLNHLGIEMVGVSRSDPSKESLLPSSRSGFIREYFTDIREYDPIFAIIQAEQPSIVIHLAAEALVQVCAENPTQAFSVNVMGTINILEAAMKVASVGVVAITTTDKVYKNENNGLAFSEDSPLEGRDPYSGSKVGQESAIFSYQNYANNVGKRLLTLRAGNVIGGADISPLRLLPDYARSMATNSILEIRNPNATRPWQHVLDCLFGYLLAIQSSSGFIDHEVFNFGPIGRSLSVSEVLEEASKISKVAVNSVNTISDFYEAKTLELNSEKSRSLLGWNPIHNQNESVEATISWWNEVLTGKHHLDVSKYETEKFFAKALND